MTEPFRPTPVCPFIHLNGTTAGALLDQRLAVSSALCDCLEKLADMAPNQRDYYPDPGRWERAIDQHRRRVGVLNQLRDEITSEMQSIQDFQDANGRY